MEILDINNLKVQKSQLEKIKKIKKKRNEKKVAKALNNITLACKSNNRNMLIK